jgi:indolepyruvate ferredoxin oxidoreductase beta subunit
MAQRGGAVIAHMRISDKPIASDLVPRGGANLILGMEPVESLRYANWLSSNGVMITAAEPVENIPVYPDVNGIINAIKKFPDYRIVEASALAKEAGLARSVNMVMVGAASTFLPIKPETIEKTIKRIFGERNPELVEANLKAFGLGRNAAK